MTLPDRPLRPSQITAVRPASTRRLQQLAERVARGELVFLRTKPGRHVGERLQVALVYRETDAEFTVGVV